MNLKDFIFRKNNSDDIIRKLIEKACQVLIEEKKFPAHVCFDIPNSSYLAHIFLTKDLIHEDEWRLQVGVMEDGYDKMFSIFLNHDMKENLLELLKSSQIKNEIFDSIKSLHVRAEQDD